MKTLKTNIAIYLLVLLNTFSFAQKKKEIRNFGIKTITVSDTRNDKTTNDNTITYNNQGEIVEEINYDKDGNLKSVTKYKYNQAGDVIEQIEYDSKNEIREKKQITYNKKIKTEELIVNKDNKTIKKYTYTYNNNGLKKERKTFDSLNVLISTKKYDYSFKKN